MAGQAAAMHVARIRSGYTDKQGRRRQYESRLLRRTYRDGGKVRHETLANLSGLPEAVVDSIEAALKGAALVPAGQAEAVTITRSLPHGHVAAVHAMAAKLGLPRLLGPACPQRDLALALIISRVAAPGSKLSTLAWWSDTTLGTDLGVDGATTDEVYAAMDWLEGRQDAIEARLARRHLAPAANPQRMALSGLSSSWLEGSCCPLGQRGHSRDGKKGKVQIEYGLLTDPGGRPVAVRVFEGNTADPAAFTEITGVVRDKFGLRKMVMAGDRGMITTARIKALAELDDKYGWITALRAPAIGKLMADDGPLQLSLFDEQDLAEISSPDFPGERLVACRNPVLAEQRARKREDLLAATEKLLAPLIARVQAGRLRGAAAIGTAVGKVIGRYKMARHLEVTITDDSLSVTRRQDRIDAEAALDGIYVIRTPVPDTELDAPAVVTAYKNLKYVERDFRHIKADDLDLRPGIPPAGTTRQGPRADLHARRLPGLAPAPGVSAADLHRPGPARPAEPGRARPPLRGRGGQGLPPARRERTPLPQLPRPARPPGHPDPQPGPLRRRPRGRPRAHRAHQPAAPGLRPHRHPHPAHLEEVARTTTRTQRKTAGQRQARLPNHP